MIDWATRAREIRQRNLMPTELDAEIAALAAEAFAAGSSETAALAYQEADRERAMRRAAEDRADSAFNAGHAAGVAEALKNHICEPAGHNARLHPSLVDQCETCRALRASREPTHQTTQLCPDGHVYPAESCPLHPPMYPHRASQE